MAAQDLPLAQEPEGAYLAAFREDYFSALAEAFPTLCLHDEFIFFPRLSAAWEHWFKVAQLHAPVIEATAARMSEILARLEEAAVQTESPEAISEAALLRQSLKSVLRELGPGGPWEEDPFLYLKVAALAWAPVLARASHLDWQNEEKLAHLLARTAQLFAWGREQVRALTLPGQLLSSGAFADARFFFHQVVPDFLEAYLPRRAVWKRLLEAVSQSLQAFREHVASLPARAPFARGEAGLTRILAESWGWSGDLEAAAAILTEELEECEAALSQQSGQISPGRPWQETLATFEVPSRQVNLLGLYRREVADLWDFWGNSGLLPPLQGRVEVAETPVYLRTLRSSASYAAPWGPPEKSPGFFYLSPGTEDLAHHLQHYRCLSAHETVPGHHLLDTTRLSLASPLRRQYESPLFYEGWACYGETLLFSEGYLVDPRQHLVGWQRRLWRALRGLADLDLQQRRGGLEEGLKCLFQAGYPESAAKVQILHLALNPGYQLCYTLGLKEMLSLRARFAPVLGLARFHDLVLSGGQAPFYLVESALEAAGSNRP